MSELKEQRPAESSAERTLRFLGYTNEGGEQWKPPLGQRPTLGAPAPSEDAKRLKVALERLLERFMIVYGEPAAGTMPHEVTIARAALAAATGPSKK